jgi:hypothetical protein
MSSSSSAATEGRSSVRGRNGAEFACKTNPPRELLVLLLLELPLLSLPCFSVLGADAIVDEVAVCCREVCNGALKADVVAALAVKDNNDDDEDAAEVEDVNDVGDVEADAVSDAEANAAVTACAAVATEAACDAPVLVMMMDLLAFSLPPLMTVALTAALANPVAALLDDGRAFDCNCDCDCVDSAAAADASGTTVGLMTRANLAPPPPPPPVDLPETSAEAPLPAKTGPDAAADANAAPSDGSVPCDGFDCSGFECCILGACERALGCCDGSDSEDEARGFELASAAGTRGADESDEPPGIEIVADADADTEDDDRAGGGGGVKARNGATPSRTASSTASASAAGSTLRWRWRRVDDECMKTCECVCQINGLYSKGYVNCLDEQVIAW